MHKLLQGMKEGIEQALLGYEQMLWEAVKEADALERRGFKNILIKPDCVFTLKYTIYKEDSKMTIKEFSEKHNIEIEKAELAAVRSLFDIDRAGLPWSYNDFLNMEFEEGNLIKAAEQNGNHIKFKEG